MRASGQKLVKFCTVTHTLTHAAKLVVRITVYIYGPIGNMQPHVIQWNIKHPERTIHIFIIIREHISVIYILIPFHCNANVIVVHDVIRLT